MRHPGLRALLASGLLVAAPAHAASCPGPAMVFEPLAPGLWLLRGATAEASPVNRGQVSNLLLGRHQGGLWLLGSGPSPAFGRALACQARRQLGLPLRAVISPWARPELVLGVGGLGPLPHWAHAQVAQAMARQCPTCVARLRQQLGQAAADLGPHPIHPPGHLLQGDQGRLGPWLWWRLPRDAGRSATVWRWAAAPVWAAPGLIAGEGTPDGRDADLALLSASVGRLPALAAADGAAARWVGEQGGVQDAQAPARQVAYWQALAAGVRAAIRAGVAETDAPAALPGVADAWQAQLQHALNWQRAWRQLEPGVLDEPPVRTGPVP